MGISTTNILLITIIASFVWTTTSVDGDCFSEYRKDEKSFVPNLFCVEVAGLDCGLHGTELDPQCNCTCRCDSGYAGVACNTTINDVDTPFGFSRVLRRRKYQHGIQVNGTIYAAAPATENEADTRPADLTVEFWYKPIYPAISLINGENTFFEFRTPNNLNEPGHTPDPNQIPGNWKLLIGFRLSKIIAHIQVDKGNKFFWEIVLSSVSERVFSVNQPHHIALVIKTDLYFGETSTFVQQFSLYLDGVLEDTRSQKRKDHFTYREMVLGTHWNNIDPIRITPKDVSLLEYDEFRLWEVARSQDEIKQTMYTPLLGNETGLAIYYTFDDADDTVVYNKAWARAGTLNGIRTTTDPNTLNSDDPRMYPLHLPSFVPTQAPSETAVTQQRIRLLETYPTGTKPTLPLYGHSSSIIGDKMWVIGGSHEISFAVLPVGLVDVYYLHIPTKTWYKPTGIVGEDDVFGSGAEKKGILLHTATIFEETKILILGGDNEIPFIAIFDTETLTWTKPTGGDLAIVPVLGGHTSNLIGNKLYTFGSATSFLVGATDTLFILTLNTWEIEIIDSSTNPTADWPPARFFHAALHINGTNGDLGKIVIYGGILSVSDDTLLDDIWELNVATRVWKRNFLGGATVPKSKLWFKPIPFAGNLLLHGGLIGVGLQSAFANTANVSQVSKDGQMVLLRNDGGELSIQTVPKTSFDGAQRFLRFAHTATLTPDGTTMIVYGGFKIDQQFNYCADCGDYAAIIWPGDDVLFFDLGCGSGTQKINGTCHPCQPGTFRSSLLGLIPEPGTCQPCPGGQFQKESGQSSCELCPQGSYAPPPGAAKVGAVTCVPCESKFTTGRGSTSAANCTSSTVEIKRNNDAEIYGTVFTLLIIFGIAGGVGGYYGRKKYLQQQAELKNYGHIPVQINEADFQGISFLKRSDLEMGTELGSGSFGAVYKGTYKDKIVAIKVSKPGAKEGVEEFLREAEVMMQIDQHENVIQLVGVCVAGGSALVVLEFVDGGSLKDLLQKGHSFGEAELKKLIRQIASGLKHVHGHNLIHRDLAARNILLQKDGNGGYVPKISDFGMSRVTSNEQQQGQTQTNFGPIPWMSPEAIGSLTYSPQSDIWSFGVLLWEVLTGFDPSVQMPLVDLAVAVRDKGFHPKIPPFIPSWLEQILLGCWKFKPEDRITLEQILKLLDDPGSNSSVPATTATKKETKKDVHSTHTNKTTAPGKRRKSVAGGDEVEALRAKLDNVEKERDKLKEENEKLKKQLQEFQKTNKKDANRTNRSESTRNQQQPQQPVVTVDVSNNQPPADGTSTVGYNNLPSDNPQMSTVGYGGIPPTQQQQPQQNGGVSGNNSDQDSGQEKPAREKMTSFAKGGGWRKSLAPDSLSNINVNSDKS